jgi:hypothetical protein
VVDGEPRRFETLFGLHSFTIDVSFTFFGDSEPIFPTDYVPAGCCCAGFLNALHILALVHILTLDVAF